MTEAITLSWVQWAWSAGILLGIGALVRDVREMKVYLYKSVYSKDVIDAYRDESRIDRQKLWDVVNEMREHNAVR